MADLIERNPVKKKQVVCTVSSVDIHSGEEFCATGHSGKFLELLYEVWRA